MPRNSRNHPPLPLIRNGEMIREVPEDQSFLIGSYTGEALLFIEQHQEEPFFPYVPHSMVHVPLYAGDTFRRNSSHGILADDIEELDLERRRGSRQTAGAWPGRKFSGPVHFRPRPSRNNGLQMRRGPHFRSQSFPADRA